MPVDFLGLLNVVFYLIGFGLIGYGLWNARRSMQAASWPTALATVNSVAVRETTDEDGTTSCLSYGLHCSILFVLAFGVVGLLLAIGLTLHTRGTLADLQVVRNALLIVVGVALLVLAARGDRGLVDNLTAD